MTKHTYDFPMSPVAATMALLYQEDADTVKVYIGERKSGPGTIYGGQWCLPGGYMEAGVEGSRTTATRETEEEVGILIAEGRWLDLGVDDEPGGDPRYAQVINICYAVWVTDAEFKSATPGDDLVDGKWVTVSEAQKMELAFRHNMILNWAEMEIIR